MIVLLGGSASAVGTPVLIDIRPGSVGSSPTELTDVNGTVFFNAVWQNYLWKSDGTTAGTVPVGDFNVPVTELTAVGETLFFTADDGTIGRQLWKSDGTDAGTVLVKEIMRARDRPPPTELTAVGETLFFRAFRGTKGEELWKSDGTEAGTVLVKDIVPGLSSSVPERLTDVAGTLFFVADDGVHGKELWKSDGNEAGTVLVKDIAPGLSGSSPLGLTEVAGRLYMTATDGTTGRELWKSDGTEAGTVLVRDIYPGENGFAEAVTLTALGSALIFLAADDVHGTALWRSDGSEAGTVLVKDLGPAIPPTPFVEAGGRVFFHGDASDGHAAELWATDGTETGTTLVKDITPGPYSSQIRDLTDVGGRLFFEASECVATCGSEAELWTSDGTPGGTKMVADIYPGETGSLPDGLTDVGGSLFFTANDGTHGHELWTLPPLASGCILNGSMLSIMLPQDGSVTIGRSGASFDIAGTGITDPTCGGATVNNVDLVEVTGTAGAESATLDMSGGRFEPGMTPEDAGISEIEIHLSLGAGVDSLMIEGTNGDDRIIVGTVGAALNEDSDGDDATFAGLESFTIRGGDGNDQLQAGGEAYTTGLPLPNATTLDGGQGRDNFIGGLGDDTVNGGPDNDVYRSNYKPDGADVFHGGPGIDTASYEFHLPEHPTTADIDGVADDGRFGGAEGDNIETDVERLMGGYGDDMLTATLPAGNVVRGGRGTDSIDVADGIGGNDRADGGKGTEDTCSADAGDTVRNCEG